MNALLGPTDHVVVQWPCFQSLHDICQAIGCDVTLWKADADDAWRLDNADLRAAIRPNTKLIVLNTPHNPTGYLMPADQFREVVQIASEARVTLLSDEVYRLLEYDDADRLPAACDLYDGAVSLGVMSKAFGLAGLRIGWVATKNRELLEQMAAFKDYTSICNSAPSEFLATLALRVRHKIIERNMGIIRRNLQLLDSFFARHKDLFEWHRPKVGAIAFPKLRIEVDSEAFCEDLVKRSGVLLLPSTCYSYDVGGVHRHFRLGFGRASMPESLQQLEAYIADQHLARLSAPG
eukprot:TRINITY_DN6436_c0_g1_i1.p2 TRINITY_DN6436_c0_g1~~TRINITY_DN6436_c0_g1_i1.p2  ORF type:complete len:292 (-),score=91.48 TRINITY_DN6436_c0_g1_i1:180-1055(-)